MNLIINDVKGLPPEFIEQLKDFGLAVVSAAELTSQLLAWEKWNTLNPKTTLLVFPGNGATIVRDFLPDQWLEQWPHQAKIQAKRLTERSD